MNRLAAACLFIAACGDARADDVDVDPPDQSLSAAGDVWESSPWSGPFLEYRGETRLRVSHTLGRVPRVVLVYVSFEEDGFRPALAAGDVARIGEVTADTVTVENTTNQRFFMRLVLQ